MSWKFCYWYRENFFNLKERKKITSFFETNYQSIETKEETAKNKKGISKKQTKTLKMSWEKIKPFVKNLEDTIVHDNESNFGYNLFPVNNLNKVLLNIYSSQDKGNYDWHEDGAESDLIDCKLTALVNLSESYEGGDLWIFQGGPQKVKAFKPGTLLLLKSSISHKVEPVTKGVRKTLTMFLQGPKFR